MKERDNFDLDFEEFNLEDFNFKKKEKQFNLSNEDLVYENSIIEQSMKKEFRVFLIMCSLLTASVGALTYYAVKSSRESYKDNNPNISKGYYVFKGEGKTTIYDTFGYNGNRVDYTKMPGNIGSSNIGMTESKLIEQYNSNDISKSDLLFQEQNSNKDGIVIFVDNYGVASFYENYQLVEKVDLVGKKVIDITGNSETIAEDENSSSLIQIIEINKIKKRLLK